jgi:large subunit ribosomal protein L23
MSFAYYIIKRPLITEKSDIARENNNKYVFEVKRNANKIEIKNAIEEIFKVKVLDVNTIIVPGKVRRIGRNMGKRSSWKKAIVKLKEGYKIDFLEGK